MSETTATTSTGRTVRCGDLVYWARGENLGGAPFVGRVHAINRDGGKVHVFAYGGFFVFRPEEVE